MVIKGELEIRSGYIFKCFVFSVVFLSFSDNVFDKKKSHIFTLFLSHKDLTTTEQAAISRGNHETTTDFKHWFMAGS